MSTSQTTDVDTSSTLSLLAELFAPIADDLADSSERLRAELRHNDPSIDQLARHSFRLGGKRLRPALLLLCAKATGEINDSHRTLAAVVEMIHTATLVHDDVLDEASMRRHEPTINARWNNQTSVLLGDYLFTHAFYLASTLDTTFGCRVIGRATNDVCEGELLQTSASGNFELTHEAYVKIIEAKTASLCACCCELGAHYSGANQAVVAALESYGRSLGIAFQIADDLLDLEGEEAATGKSLGTDLAHGKMTLPLIYLRDQLDSPERAQLQQMVENPSEEVAQELRTWLQTSGALDYARNAANSYAREAAESLQVVNRQDSSNPQTVAACRSLETLVEFVVSRST